MAKKNKAAKGLLAILTLPSLSIGFAVMYLFAIGPYIKVSSTNNWVATQAKVLKVHLEADSTYHTTATYSYEYQGEQYQSSQLHYYSGSDNIGSYQRDLNKRLKKALSLEKDITVFVNPDSPSEAIYDRSTRWELILFSLIICLVLLAGSGSLFGVLIFLSNQKLQLGIASESGGHIFKSSRKGKVSFSFIGSFIWNACAIALLLIMWDSIIEPSFVTTIYSLFQLAGFGLIILSIYQVMRYLKYAKSSLHLKEGIIGGPFKGEIIAPDNVHPKNAYYSIVLQSLHTYLSGSGEHRVTKQDVIWSYSCQVAEREVRKQDGKLYIPLDFFVPDSCEESSKEPNYSWVLKASASTPGIDWDDEFDLTLLKTQE